MTTCVRGDIVDEYTEYVVLSVSDGNGHSASTTVGILDEDPAPTLTAGGWWDAEGKDVDVWVTASHPTAKEHKVKLRLKGVAEDEIVTAEKGPDFADVTVTWDSEEGSGFSGAASLFNTAIHKSAKVPLVADDLDEGFEKFLVTAEVLEGDFIVGYGGFAHIAGIDLRGDLDQDGDRDADDNELEATKSLIVPTGDQGVPISVFKGDWVSLLYQLDGWEDKLTIAFTTDNTTAFSLTGGSSLGQTTIDWGAKIPITAVPSEIYVKAAEDASAVEANITAKVYWSTGAEAYAEDSILVSVAEPSGRISDRVWLDANENGLQDSLEVGLGGVPITLQAGLGESGPWAEIAQTVSSQDGSYAFDQLSAGHYRVRFGYVPGHVHTKESGLDDEQLDSNGLLPFIVSLGYGELRTDVDAGYYPTSTTADVSFSLNENSPGGTPVGTILNANVSHFSTNIDHTQFVITASGAIAVRENASLDYEQRASHEFFVIGFVNNGPDIIYHVTVRLLDLDEAPVETNPTTSLTAPPYHWAPIYFQDPEGSDIQSITGTPNNGQLIVNQTQTSSGPSGYWVPNVGATGDEFSVSASDGTNTSQPVDITVEVTGTTSFGRFKVVDPADAEAVRNGTLGPPMNVDTDLGATGLAEDIPFPDRGHDSRVGLNADLTLFKSYIPISQKFANESEQAQQAMLAYLANNEPGYTRQLNLFQILMDSGSSRQHWEDVLSEFIDVVNSKSFLGSISLVDEHAKLVSTANSPWANAVGDYTGWGSGDIEGNILDGKMHFTALFTYHLWDPYDWDPTKLWTNAYAQFPLAMLHLAGIARQYMTTGTYTVSFGWFKGDSPAVSDIFANEVYGGE